MCVRCRSSTVSVLTLGLVDTSDRRIGLGRGGTTITTRRRYDSWTTDGPGHDRDRSSTKVTSPLPSWSVHFGPQDLGDPRPDDPRRRPASRLPTLPLSTIPVSNSRVPTTNYCVEMSDFTTQNPSRVVRGTAGVKATGSVRVPRK